jgi:transcription elongation factor Elf1
MPIDMKDGTTLHCPTCGEEIKVAWLIENDAKRGEACFCKCPEHEFLTGYEESELQALIDVYNAEHGIIDNEMN